MKRNKYLIVLLPAILLILCFASVKAQNPVIRDQFTADPTARVFNGKVYLYPSHDIPARPGRGRANWFVMEDYHVFSSSNLTDWTDHGVILSQNKVNWVDSTSFSMWAPDCVYKNGKYYFYFPSNAKTEYGRGFSIGVAVSDNPSGPFVPVPTPIKNVKGIDPVVFIDKDGQAYIYYSLNKIYAARLADNMTELASEPKVMTSLPTQGLVEGPFVFERNGIYYLTYPHVENKTERLEYATSDNPLGPFTVKGVIMDESPTGCWTNHHSLVEYKNQWYLFYHHNDLSPKFDKNRSARVDSLFFNNDGTIRKVIPTLRGVGISDATRNIEIDRYSSKSDAGASIAFIDSLNTFKGWKAVLSGNNSWMRYNAVDFGSKKIKTLLINARSPRGGILQVMTDGVNGTKLAEVKIPAGNTFNTITTAVKGKVKGVHDLVVVLKEGGATETDWLKFVN
ncbi:MAG: family 43 glycosylhydrolase [Bacteroidales bacterium]